MPVLKPSAQIAIAILVVTVLVVITMEGDIFNSHGATIMDQPLKPFLEMTDSSTIPIKWPLMRGLRGKLHSGSGANGFITRPEFNKADLELPRGPLMEVLSVPVLEILRLKPDSGFMEMLDGRLDSRGLETQLDVHNRIFVLIV